jgi:hypothetical protein
MGFDDPVTWVAGGLLLTAAFLLLRRYFTAEARERRRRDRSHGRVVAKGKRPMIKLAVKVEKPKNGGQG